MSATTVTRENFSKQMSATEIDVAIHEAFNEIPDGWYVNKDTIMKFLMPMVNGKADDKLVSELVDKFIAEI